MTIIRTILTIYSDIAPVINVNVGSADVFICSRIPLWNCSHLRWISLPIRKSLQRTQTISGI